MLREIVLSSALLFFLLQTASAADRRCNEDSLPCDDGQCVRREDWCDGSKTCKDGSDEAYCGEPKWWGISFKKCDTKIHFKCDDGPCWPLAARCDGTSDCGDASDEEECDSGENGSDGSDEKTEESDEVKDNSKEIKNKEYEDNLKESSGEEEEVPLTTETPTTTTTSNDYDNYDENGEITEAPLETTTVKFIPPPLPPIRKAPSTERPVSPEVFSWEPTTEKDYYAKKMEQSDVKRQQSTQTYMQPTSAYRQPPLRPVVQYPTRPYQNQYVTSRRPAVPYTGPTRPYTPRPYRYIGARGQRPSSYRGRYQHHQPAYPPNGYRGSYHPSENNYISSQPRTDYRQANGNNGREDWRNGVSSPPRAYGRQLRAPSRFDFKKDYNEIYGRSNGPSVRRGVDWILSIRNATGGWGKETPRALVALSLVNNSFLTGNHENDLMQKYFQVHLAVKLLRDEPVSLNRLAMFVNALIATCQDPRDFQGWDLTELIRHNILKQNRASRSSRTPVVNPLVYLSLCLADRNLTHYEVHHLMTYLAANRNDEATRDMRCLALEAFACHMQKERHNADQYYNLQKMVWNATSRILQRRKEDGSFGSVYSTALAVQALLSVNETLEWNPEPSFRFLKDQQQTNGSFGDFLATYQVLPALSGRSLLHIRNTECNPPRVDRELTPQEILRHPGPKSYVRYSLHLGSPLSTGYTVQVLVPTGISFFDVMRVAAYENEHFKFSYEEVNGKINVYSISDIPNDPEEGLAWRLYVRHPADNGNIPNIQQLYTGDIRELLPTPDQHVVFWYHPSGF